MNPPRQGKGTGRHQPIPRLLAQLRRMDGGDLDFCVEEFDGSVVSGCSLSQIATAGAQLFASDDAHITAVAELGRDVGDLLETFLDPEAFGEPAGVDRLLRVLRSAASWEQAVGETAVWEWFRCVAEAAFAAATGIGLDGTHGDGSDATRGDRAPSPRVAAVEAVLLLQQGDRAAAAAVVERYAAELVPVLIGPAGTLLAAPLMPLLCGVAPRSAIAILNGRTEPYVGASMLIQSLPDPRARALQLDLVVACCQALERWAFWGVGVRRGPLLPPTHSDRFNVKRWETDSALLRLNFARHAAGVGDAATALTLLDDRDDPAAELARICADLAVYGFRVLEYPDNPARFTAVSQVLFGHGRTIERLHAKWGGRPGDDTLLVRSESALARAMLAVVRAESGAYEYFTLAVAHLHRFDGPWPWWMLAAASQDRDIGFILRELARCAQLAGLHDPPRGLLLDIAERCGVDWSAAEQTARAAIEGAIGPDVEPGMTPSTVYHKVAPLVHFYLDRSRCTHHFLASLAKRCDVLLEPSTEALQLDDADAHAVFVAASIVDIANTHLDRFAPLEVGWLEADSDDDAEIDDAADREAIEQRRNERARRRAERRRPASSTSDTTVDDSAVRGADRVDDAPALAAALGGLPSTADRRLLVEFGERLEAADSLEPDALRSIADAWLTVLSHRDVRVALGDSGCDLEMIRALRRIDRPADAAPIAVGLFWRTHNSGSDPSDYAALAEELGAGAEDLAAIEGASTANRDDQGGRDGDAVSVVFVGGREEQARVASLVESDVADRFDDRVSITWFHPGWTSGWATDADRIAGALGEAHVAVVMSLVRTGLGERVRRDAKFYDVPWVPCTGHGRASMTRAVTAAVAVVDDLRHDTDAEPALASRTPSWHRRAREGAAVPALASRTPSWHRRARDGGAAMRVLMLESHVGLGSGVVERLTAAGHSIVRCDSPDRSLPCRGIAPDQGCPLDEPVDVAVLVQEPGLHDVEHGALCAARQRIPIVDVASTRFEPASPLASVTTTGGEDVVSVCEWAASDGRAHVNAVTRRLLQLGVVTADELDHEHGTVVVDIVRSDNRLRLIVELDLAAAARETEIVRAAEQALRAFDRQTRVIDVTVRRRPPID